VGQIIETNSRLKVATIGKTGSGDFFLLVSEPFIFRVYRVEKHMIFQKKQYIALILILSLLILGFILMSGGGSDDPNVFNNEMFSFRRITLAPIMIIGSYVALIWLILKKPAP